MAEAESITCPRCGMTSWNPNDVTHGYCGHCHDYTSPRATLAGSQELKSQAAGVRSPNGPPAPVAQSAEAPDSSSGSAGSTPAGGTHEHHWMYEDDEYGSLADGGSYEVWRCSDPDCGKVKYVQLPD